MCARHTCGGENGAAAVALMRARRGGGAGRLCPQALVGVEQSNIIPRRDRPSGILFETHHSPSACSRRAWDCPGPPVASRVWQTCRGRAMRVKRVNRSTFAAGWHRL